MPGSATLISGGLSSVTPNSLVLTSAELFSAELCFTGLISAMQTSAMPRSLLLISTTPTSAELCFTGLISAMQTSAEPSPKGALATPEISKQRRKQAGTPNVSNNPHKNFLGLFYTGLRGAFKPPEQQ